MDRIIKSDSENTVKPDTGAKTETCGIKCEECSDVLRNQRRYKEHQRKWHIFFSCPECPKIIKGNRRFKSHWENHAKFQCPQCNKILNHKHRNRHFELCEKLRLRKRKPRKKRIPKHVCDLCNYAATTQRLLGRHLTTHVEKPKVVHKCEHCDFQTRKTTHMRSHVINCAANGENVIWF